MIGKSTVSSLLQIVDISTETQNLQTSVNGLYATRAFSLSKAYWNLNYRTSLIALRPWKLIWKNKISLKVSCFAWLVVSYEHA